jgi:hypothetical protein
LVRGGRDLEDARLVPVFIDDLGVVLVPLGESVVSIGGDDEPILVLAISIVGDDEEEFEG